MGARGPAPTPTDLKIVRGNPGHRPINKDEPKPEKTRPEMPSLIEGDEAAKRHYNDMVTLTENMHVLTVADGAALGKVAWLEARFNEMAAGVAASGLLVKNKSTGMVHINPLLKQMKEFLPDLWKAYREFGFTPAARVNLKTTDAGDKPEDPWSKF